MMLSIVINTRNRKQMLFDLLSSIYRCDLNFSYEIIIVDDYTEEKYETELLKKFPKVVFIKTSKRVFLIKARNLGWQKAKGDIVFFIDDDNEVKDHNMFNKAIKIFKERRDIGILGCRTYYFDKPEYIQMGTNSFNKKTGRTTFPLMNKKELKKPPHLTETHNCPNAFVVPKSVIERVGGFTEDIIQTMSEADLAEKVRKLGLKVYDSPELKVYHKTPWQEYKKISARNVGGSPERSYYLMRNRFLFIKRYGSLYEKFLFTVLFSHVINVYYILQLLRLKELKMVKQAIRGVFDGYFYMITGKLNNYYL